jgi:hypothetical protein
MTKSSQAFINGKNLIIVNCAQVNIQILTSIIVHLYRYVFLMKLALVKLCFQRLLMFIKYDKENLLEHLATLSKGIVVLKVHSNCKPLQRFFQLFK